MDDTPQCRATWWRPCNWEGRYDTTPPESFVKALGAMPDEATPLMIKTTMEGATARRYVREVCTRCGAVKERAPA